MLAKPAANAIADIGRAVSSIRAFARCTRRVVATAVGEAPAWRRNRRRRCRAVMPSVSARSSTLLASSRNPHSMRRSARETVAAAPGAARRSRPKTARRWPARPVASWPGMRARYFYGWNVVAATFVMALFTFGLGFYGLTVYVAALQRLHGWSAAAVSAPVTVYYVAGALLTTAIGSVYERFGPRLVVVGASVVMAGGIMALGLVTQPWQLYPVFLVMAVGWGSMSGAAINIILAPWFERRRGLAVSVAFNGATLGGVTVAPMLIPLIAVLGFTRALVIAGLVSFGAVIAVAAAVMRRGPEALGLGPDGEAAPS